MSVRFAIALLAGALGIVSPAAHADDFYKGKVVTVLVNYTAGGPTDIEARLVAHYLVDHIPGKPTVIVKNMPGAGGNIGANFLGEVAGKDGLTVSFFTWSPIDQVLDDPGLRIRYNNFVFIAGIGMPAVVYARTDMPPGIAKAADIMKTPMAIIGTLSLTSPTTLESTLPLDLLGLKYKVVHGYKGLKDIETAVLQNEVQFTAVSLAGYRSSIEPNMAKNGLVAPLWHYEIEDANGKFTPSAEAADIPGFLDVYRQLKGGTPSGLHWEALALSNKIMSNMFRAVFMPPGSPKQAVADMRAGYAGLAKDEAFLAEYEKIAKYRATFVGGAEGEKLIAALGNVQPELVAFMKDYVNKLAK